MRKVLSILTVLLICLSLAVPAFAAEEVYVPSITAKPAPELDQSTQDATGIPVIQVKDEKQEIVHVSPIENLVVTPVANVMADEEVRISEEAQEILKEAFETLDTKGVEVFEEVPELVQLIQEADIKVEDLVVMDLFDVTILNEELEEYLNVEGNTIELTFAMNLPADQEVYVMVFKNSQWILAESAVNNGDGSVTCAFEHFCPVAILTAPVVTVEETEPAVEVAPEAETETQPAAPEAPAVQEQSASFPWWIILVVAVVVIVLIVVKGKKSKEKV